MRIVDSHTHIYGVEFDIDRHEMMSRALKAGVRRMILPSIDRTTYEAMMACLKDFPSMVYPTLGLHPTHVKDDFEQEIDFVRERLPKDRHHIVAIGEIGLDYYWDISFKDQQKIAFKAQIELALEHNLPIIIHTREAWDDTFAILDIYRDRGLRGVFHSFTAGQGELERALEYPDFMIGIGGVLTFKNSTLSDFIATTLPLSRLLVETDAPYLSPVPMRGKRNEPSFLIHIIRHLSMLYEISQEELSEIVWHNTNILFNLPE